MVNEQVPVARDFMMTHVVTVSPDMDIFAAVDVLLSHKVAGAPVVDSNGKLLGFLSEADCLIPLVDAAYETEPSISVGKCMSTQVQTVKEDTDVLVIAELFLQHKHRRLPVVREGILVGIVGRQDFLKAIVQWTCPPADPKKPPFLSSRKISKDLAARIS